MGRGVGLGKVIHFSFCSTSVVVVVKDGSDDFHTFHVSELRPKQVQWIILYHGDYIRVC